MPGRRRSRLDGVCDDVLEGPVSAIRTMARAPLKFKDRVLSSLISRSGFIKQTCAGQRHAEASSQNARRIHRYWGSHTISNVTWQSGFSKSTLRPPNSLNRGWTLRTMEGPGRANPKSVGCSGRQRPTTPLMDGRRATQLVHRLRQRRMERAGHCKGVAKVRQGTDLEATCRRSDGNGWRSGGENLRPGIQHRVHQTGLGG